MSLPPLMVLYNVFGCGRWCELWNVFFSLCFIMIYAHFTITFTWQSFPGLQNTVIWYFSRFIHSVHYTWASGNQVYEIRPHSDWFGVVRNLNHTFLFLDKIYYNHRGLLFIKFWYCMWVSKNRPILSLDTPMICIFFFCVNNLIKDPSQQAI